MAVCSDICIRCAERFGSCCISANPKSELYFPVMEKDIKLLEQFQGEQPALQKVNNSDDFHKTLFSFFPEQKERILEIFPKGASHYTFKILEDGRCSALGENGCILPYHLRPEYCKLFPFWVYAGKVTYFNRDECLAVRNSRDLNLLLKYFNTDSESIMRIFMNLCQDWGLKFE